VQAEILVNTQYLRYGWKFTRLLFSSKIFSSYRCFMGTECDSKKNWYRLNTNHQYTGGRLGDINGNVTGKCATWAVVTAVTQQGRRERARVMCKIYGVRRAHVLLAHIMTC